MVNAGCEEGVKHHRCKGTCYAALTYTNPNANKICNGKCKQMFGISHDSDCLIWDFECCCGPKAVGVRSYPNKYDSVDHDAQNNAYDPQTATGNAGGEPLPRSNDDESESDTDSGYASSPSDTTEDHGTISDVYDSNRGFIFPDPNTVYHREDNSENSENDSFETGTSESIDDSDYSANQSSDETDNQSNTTLP